MNTPNDPDTAALLAYCQGKGILRTNAGRTPAEALRALRRCQADVARASFPPSLFYLLR